MEKRQPFLAMPVSGSSLRCAFASAQPDPDACGTAGANQRVLAQTHWQNAIKSFFPVTGDSIDIEIKAFCANQAIPPGRSKPIEFWRGQLSANNVPPTNRRARLDQFRPQGRD